MNARDAAVVLPFQFERKPNARMLIVNQCGEFLYVSTNEFERLISNNIERNTGLYFKLKNKHFIADKDKALQIELIATQLRSRKAYLKDFTSLHMVVVTCRCNFKCDYCHASSAELGHKNVDMNWKTAKKTVDMIFSSPSPIIKIEFQGGEPLLNWKIIQEIVEYGEILNKFAKRRLEFVICTNLTLLDRNILDYCKRHSISISTSLDGNKAMQNKHRKHRQGKDGYEEFINKLNLLKEETGDNYCSPLVTITKSNLFQLSTVIDHYIELGFNGVFLRALNPYGYARTNKEHLSYSTEEFVQEYKKALEYIIEKNLQGIHFVEYYAALLLQRILTPFSTGFVDLQSPSGAAISGAIYDYNGDVYVSDEGRMLARNGDKTFCMGNVLKNKYKEIFTSQIAKKVVKTSCVEILPGCTSCVYQLYCGADPVRNYAETGTLYGQRSTSEFCKKNKAILDYLMQLIDSNNSDIDDVFWSWITGRTLGAIRNDYS